MLYILLGNNSKSKKDFIDKQKEKFSESIWGKQIEQFFAKEFTSKDAINHVLRMSSLSGERLVIFWDIDKLKQNLRNTLISLIKKYILNSDVICLIIEGLGQRGTFSYSLRSNFPNNSLVMGEINPRESFFDLASMIVEGQIVASLRLFDAFKIDKFSFPQLLGALRVVIMERIKQDYLRWRLLGVLLETDVVIKLSDFDPRMHFLDMFFKIRSLVREKGRL